jgi:hypothetical protein
VSEGLLGSHQTLIMILRYKATSSLLSPTPTILHSDESNTSRTSHRSRLRELAKRSSTKRNDIPPRHYTGRLFQLFPTSLFLFTPHTTVTSPVRHNRHNRPAAKSPSPKTSLFSLSLPALSPPSQSNATHDLQVFERRQSNEVHLRQRCDAVVPKMAVGEQETRIQ